MSPLERVRRFLSCSLVIILFVMPLLAISPSNMVTAANTISSTQPHLPQIRSAARAADVVANDLNMIVPQMGSHASQAADGPRAPRTFSANKSQPLYTINVTTGFDGLHYGCNQGGYCTGRVPPDVQVASSPKYVLEMVNSLGGTWDKQGNPIKTFTLTSLFQTDVTHVLFDPRVLYDVSSQRWFATVSDRGDQTFRFTVSQTDDPNSRWWTYRFALTPGTWADQPLVATSGDKLVISLNDYYSSNASFAGAEYWVIDKREALEGAPLNYVVYGPDENLFSVHPAKSTGENNTIYMLSVEEERGYVKLFRIDGLPPSSQVSTLELPVSAITPPPNATQFGSDFLLDTGDTRVMDATWDNGTLWLTFTDGCVPYGDTQIRSCIRLIQLNTNTNKILQNFLLSAVGSYYFYPTLSLDSAGNLVVGFGYSSAKDSPSFAVWAQPLDSPNAISHPQALRLGNAPVTPVASSCENRVCRYGDYFGSAVDPQTGLVWVAGEIQDQSGWATYIASVSVQRVPTTFPLTLSYQIEGGGSGYSPPVLSYLSNGEGRTELLSTRPKAYNLDIGTLANITTTLIGSTETERWVTDQPTSGIGESRENLTISYFHQYIATFDWTTSDGSRSSIPELNITQFGGAQTVALTGSSSAVWVDSGSRWTLSKQLHRTDLEERWYADQATDGYITERFRGVFTYLHQFFVSVSAEPNRGGSVSPPSGWYGSGSLIQLSSSANSGWQFEGWNGNGLTSYTGPRNSVNLNVNAPLTEIAIFFPGVTVSAGPRGSVSYTYGAKSGIVNESSTSTIYVPAGTKVSFSANPSSPLTPLRAWHGDVTGTSSSISVIVDSPLRVNAEFSNDYLVPGSLIFFIAVVAVVIAIRRSRKRRANLQEIT
ncbi:MAG: hypothetical protein HYY68_08255 [Thaumarchaeota archaeon]|nr:hypothetical protein [Nitrososphaerota archaeon]